MRALALPAVAAARCRPYPAELAETSGRATAFSAAALRRTFAGGKDLSHADDIMTPAPPQLNGRQVRGGVLVLLAALGLLDQRGGRLEALAVLGGQLAGAGD